MYRIVASTDKGRGDFGGWDIEIAAHQNQYRCQDVVKDLVGEYTHVWYQSSDIEQLNDEELDLRKRNFNERKVMGFL